MQANTAHLLQYSLPSLQGVSRPQNHRQQTGVTEEMSGGGSPRATPEARATRTHDESHDFARHCLTLLVMTASTPSHDHSSMPHEG